ncbi:hypothetical protein WG66_002965 [Moniliophthora roreri]|nr:hypothetical protein WG66_002965 [Moniliophthora roreri]
MESGREVLRSAYVPLRLRHSDANSRVPQDLFFLLRDADDTRCLTISLYRRIKQSKRSILDSWSKASLCFSVLSDNSDVSLPAPGGNILLSRKGPFSTSYIFELWLPRSSPSSQRAAVLTKTFRSFKVPGSQASGSPNSVWARTSEQCPILPARMAIGATKLRHDRENIWRRPKTIRLSELKNLVSRSKDTIHIRRTGYALL